MRFLAALPMRMPAISEATLAAISVYGPASRASVRLLCWLTAVACSAVGVLMGALPWVGGIGGLCTGWAEKGDVRVLERLGQAQQVAVGPLPNALPTSWCGLLGPRRWQSVRLDLAQWLGWCRHPSRGDIAALPVDY